LLEAEDVNVGLVPRSTSDIAACGALVCAKAAEADFRDWRRLDRRWPKLALLVKQPPRLPIGRSLHLDADAIRRYQIPVSKRNSSSGWHTEAEQGADHPLSKKPFRVIIAEIGESPAPKVRQPALLGYEGVPVQAVIGSWDAVGHDLMADSDFLDAYTIYDNVR